MIRRRSCRGARGASAATLACALGCALVGGGCEASEPGGEPRLRGTLVGLAGAAVDGVVVAATLAHLHDGPTLEPVVTDADGAFEIPLPPDWDGDRRTLVVASLDDFEVAGFVALPAEPTGEVVLEPMVAWPPKAFSSRGRGGVWVYMERPPVQAPADEFFFDFYPDAEAWALYGGNLETPQVYLEDAYIEGPRPHVVIGAVYAHRAGGEGLLTHQVRSLRVPLATR
jgi:hypothetical protein